MRMYMCFVCVCMWVVVPLLGPHHPARLDGVGKPQHGAVVDPYVELAAGSFGDAPAADGCELPVIVKSPGRFLDWGLLAISRCPVLAGEAIRVPIVIDGVCIAAPAVWTGFVPDKIRLFIHWLGNQRLGFQSDRALPQHLR